MHSTPVIRAGNEAQSMLAIGLDAAIGQRAADRRQRDAEAAARRQAARRAGKAAHVSHLIAMPRMAALLKAGALLGSASALAEALGIQPRSLRAKTGAERGVTNDDLRSAADALDARASLLTAHAQKIRVEVIGQ